MDFESMAKRNSDDTEMFFIIGQIIFHHWHKGDMSSNVKMLPVFFVKYR